MDSIIATIQGSSFYEFAALLTLAAFAGFVATALRQPLIIAFIAIGIIAGPSAMGIVTSGDEIALLSKLGIAILLFIVGLKLDLSLIKTLGLVSLTIGGIQIALTALFGHLISVMLGYPTEVSIYIAVALAFSSTIIIVKILSDKKEIDSLHGRMALGVLIIQDLAVVISMMVLATLGSGTETIAGETVQQAAAFWSAFTEVILFGVGLMAFTALFMRYGAYPLVSFMARLPELLLCFAIAWAILLAALCDVVGLSKELGGLIAGVSLASTPFREAIISRLAPLRDFLLLFFFIYLGTQLDLSLLGDQVVPALILSVYVMMFKPLIIMSIAGLLGYRKRTGFLAGLSLAQISEFSLIFIAMAATLGMVGSETLGLVTLVGIITIAVSTYFLSLSHKIYETFEPALGIFERQTPFREKKIDTKKTERAYDVILFGLGRYGHAMAEEILARDLSLLVVDFNPEEVRSWRKQRHDALYGDASDPEFYASLPLKNTKWVVSALPKQDIGVTHDDPRKILLHSLKDQKFKGKTAVACYRQESVEIFSNLGADVVFLPFHDAAEQAVTLITSSEKQSSKKE